MPQRIGQPSLHAAAGFSAEGLQPFVLPVAKKFQDMPNFFPRTFMPALAARMPPCVYVCMYVCMYACMCAFMYALT